MRVVVTGATGLVGLPLVRRLLAGGHEVVVLSRQAAPQLPAGAVALRWPQPRDWRAALDGADGVVHLAGESLAARRWDAAHKERIRRSRIDSTAALVAAMTASARPPRSLICASAVGYYGPCGDQQLTEADGPGTDFLARLCVDWEAAALAAEPAGVRVCLLRTGLVLAADGGGLPRLAAAFRGFAGGPLGNGRQWVSWIHRDDLVELIAWLLVTEPARGPVNAVAPSPQTNADFARQLGRALRRPCWLPAPAFALRLALGEMADAMLLAGQRVLPQRALALGYEFRHPELAGALASLLGGSATASASAG